MNITPDTPVAPIPRWAIHRRLYQWTLSLADHKHATLVLALVSFTEAIFFPIPSLILQIPMTLQNRNKAWQHALINSVCNVLGGIAGYAVGSLFSDAVRKIFSPALLENAEKYCQDLGLLTAGAIAVHPYKLYTIAAGLFKAPFYQFLIASIIGRFGLFFLTAALLYWFGPPARKFIEKYFNIATVVLGVLLVGGLLLYRQFAH
jgi:hypothetical protein